jgi:DNA polymerase-3 subunit beta
MKISLPSQKLKSCVTLAEKFIFKSHTITALTGIKISANKNITLSSTNLSAGLSVIVPGKIENEGEIIVPGTVFAQVINTFSDDEPVMIELDQNQCIISSPRSRTVIPTLILGDFPSIPKISPDVKDGNNVFTYKAEDLLEGLKSVSFAALSSDIKPEISSVYWYENEIGSVFVATDAFRLAEKTIPLTKKPDHSPVLIPLKNIPELLRVLSDYVGQVDIITSPHQMSITHKEFYYTTRLVSGNYPSYKMIIPEKYETSVILDKSEVVKTLRGTAIFHDRFNQVKMHINPDLSQVSFTVNHSERGEMVTHIPAKITGSEVEMIIHQKNLTDVLNIISEDSIELKIVNNVKPLMIGGTHNMDFLYIMMPINRV